MCRSTTRKQVMKTALYLLALTTLLSVLTYRLQAQTSTSETFSDAELVKVANTIVRKYRESTNLDPWIDRPDFRHRRRTKTLQQMELGISIPEFMFISEKSPAGLRWDSSFVVVTTSFGSLPPVVYTTAFGRDGTLYLLRGFNSNDFGTLVRDRIGVEQLLADPTSIEKLFVEAVLDSFDEKVSLIDSHNVGDFRGRSKEIGLPSIRSEEGDLLLEFFSIKPPLGTVQQHKVSIDSKLGTIRHETIDIELSGN
jgi:hypothetical protein